MQPPQQPPGWGPPPGPQGYPAGPHGYAPQGYPPPQPTKKTPVVAILLGGLVAVCGVCAVVGALLPKPPGTAPTATRSTTSTSTSALTPTPATTPSEAPPAAAPTTEPAANPTSDRQYIPQSCAVVAHLFGAQSELSELQQDEAWRQYDGRWVRWRVKVVEVGETLGQLQLQFKCGRESLISDGIASFDDDQRARLMAVRTGRTIEIEARLSDHGRLLGLSLSDATIAGP